VTSPLPHFYLSAKNAVLHIVAGPYQAVWWQQERQYLPNLSTHTVNVYDVPTQSHKVHFCINAGLYEAVKLKLSLCLTKYALHHEGVWRSGCIDPRFLDFGTSWRWVVSFTARPPYPRYPLGRRLSGRQSRSWSHRNSNSDPSVVQPVASHYTDCAIPAHLYEAVRWQITLQLLYVLTQSRKVQ
jgi:hypothetical protein